MNQNVPPSAFSSNSRLIIPIIIGLAFPVAWLIISGFVCWATGSINKYYFYGVFSALCGGAIATIMQLSGPIANSGVASAGRNLFGIILPIVALLMASYTSYSYGGTGSSPRESDRHTPEAALLPRLTVGEINNALYEVPRRNGWEIIPTEVFCDYTVGAGEKGPEVYSGFNAAKMQGQTLVATWPQHPGWTKWAMFIKKNATDQWEPLTKKKTWRIDSSFGRVKLRGQAQEGYEPSSPFEVTLTTEKPISGARTATTKTGYPGTALEWGPLPLEIDKTPISWELYIECSHRNGMEITQKEIKENPWGVRIGSDPDDEYSCSSTVFTTTSARVKEEGDLVIGCPNIPGGVTMEVILLVTKY